jgi:putative transposase
MNRQYLKRGLELWIDTRLFVVEQMSPDGDIMLRDSLTNDFTSFTQSNFYEKFYNGEITLVERQKDKNKLPKMVTCLSQLPEAKQTETARRFNYVKRAIESGIKLTNENLRKIILEVAQETNDKTLISSSTLRRWISRYENADADVRSLAPHFRPGNRKTKFGIARFQPVTIREQEKANELNSIVETVVNESYMTMERLSVEAVYDLLEIRLFEINRFRSEGERLKSPSRTGLHKFISKIDEYERDRARFGKRIADMKHTQYGSGPEIIRPLQRADFDNTVLPFMVVDFRSRLPIGRPTYTSLIDTYSNAILGRYIGFEPPSANTIMQCLRHAILPKNYIQKIYPEIQNKWDAYGVPENIACDNGLDFLSGHYANVCLQLGVNIDYMPVRKPWYKSLIENHFGVINKKLLSRMPGKSFSNILDKADYDPSKNAVISLEALVEIIDTWTVDVYHQEIQRGYEHTGPQRIPALSWKQGIEKAPLRLPPTEDELSILLRMIDYKTVSKNGIEIFGLRYNDPGLSLVRRQLKGEKVEVRYDASDLSLIYVSDIENGIYIPVPALDRTYTKDLSLYQHRIIKKYLRDYLRSQVDSSTLLAGKARIQEIVAQEFKLTKLVRSRSKIARYEQQSSTTIQRQKLQNHNQSSTDFSNSNEIENERLLLPPAVVNDSENTPSKKRTNKKPLGGETASASVDEDNNELKPPMGEIDNVLDDSDDDLDLTGWGADFDLNTKSDKENL